jgi:hypothetical protein
MAGYSFYGAQPLVQVSGRGVSVQPIYTAGPRVSVRSGDADWTVLPSPGAMYGPLNARTAVL